MKKRRRIRHDSDISHEIPIFLPPLKVEYLHPEVEQELSNKYINGDIFIDLQENNSSYAPCMINKVKKIVVAKNNFELQTIELKLMPMCNVIDNWEPLFNELLQYTDEQHIHLNNLLKQYRDFQWNPHHLVKNNKYSKQSIEKYQHNLQLRIQEFIIALNKPVFYAIYKYNPVTLKLINDSQAMNYHFVNLAGLNQKSAHLFFYQQGLFYWFDKEQMLKYMIAYMKFLLCDDLTYVERDFVFHTLDNISLICNLWLHRVKGEILEGGYYEFAILQSYEIDACSQSRMEFIRNLVKKD